MEDRDVRRCGLSLRLGAVVSGAVMFVGIVIGASGCGPSEVGSVDLTASKAVADAKGLSPGGGGGKKSQGPKRGAAAPKSAPKRAAGRG